MAVLFLNTVVELTALERGCASFHSKMVGTGPGLSLNRLLKPMLVAMAKSGSKQSSVKCLAHKTVCFDSPLHWSRVRLTCFIQWCFRTGSVGNFKNPMPSLPVLLYSSATQYLTITSAIPFSTGKTNSTVYTDVYTHAHTTPRCTFFPLSDVYV